MRIGIDIDDTITKTWETILPYYQKIFNIDEETLKNNNPYYSPIKKYMSQEEYYKFIKPILEKEYYNIPLREHSKQALKNIKKSGNKIILVTARSNHDHDNAMKKTKSYLKYHHIPYDKIIIDARDKGKICLEEKIDLFIDDSNKHCDNVASKGIKTIMLTTDYNKNNLNHKHFSNWNEIEKYICNNK